LGKLADNASLPLRRSEVVVQEKVMEASRPSSSWWIRWRASRGHFWSPVERALFFRQLNAFYSSGIQLERALLFLSGSAAREPLQLRLKGMALQLQQGIPLIAAAQASGLFTPVHLGVLRAGEAAGELERVLGWLAASDESMTAYRSRLISKLAYPLLVCILVWLGAPVFLAGISQVMGAVSESLPSSSLHLGFVPRLLLHPWAPAVLFLLPPALAALLRRLIQTGWVMPERLPLVGHLIKEEREIWLTRVLSHLLAAGLTLPESLKLASQATGQPLQSTILSVEQGQPLAESLPEDLSRLVVSLAAVGEESGNVPEMLNHASLILEDNWNACLERLLVSFEPLVLGGLGLLAGATVFAFSGPLGELVQQLAN